MANVDKVNEIPAELAAEVEQNLSKIPEACLQVFNQCHSALHWGGNWALIGAGDPDYNTIKGIAPELRQTYAGKVTASAVVSGMLLVADTQWLLSILGSLAPRFASTKEAEYMNRVRDVHTNEAERFRKYWKKTQEGKTSMFNPKDDKGNERLSGALGVYCTNVNNTFTVNGIDYPAFKLDATTVCNIIAQSPNADRVMVSVFNPETKKSVWMPLQQMMAQCLFAKALSFPKDFQGKSINRPNALIMRFAIK